MVAVDLTEISRKLSGSGPPEARTRPAPSAISSLSGPPSATERPLAWM
jgi:hypothetical protein